MFLVSWYGQRNCKTILPVDNLIRQRGGFVHVPKTNTSNLSNWKRQFYNMSHCIEDLLMDKNTDGTSARLQMQKMKRATKRCNQVDDPLWYLCWKEILWEMDLSLCVHCSHPRLTTFLLISFIYILKTQKQVKWHTSIDHYLPSGSRPQMPRQPIPSLFVYIQPMECS